MLHSISLFDSKVISENKSAERKGALTEFIASASRPITIAKSRINKSWN